MDRAAQDDLSGTVATGAPEQTRAIGRALGTVAEPGSMICLVGPLGAGKTELAKGVAEGLGIRTIVNSPTFVLMNEHAGRLRLFHIDAYRLDDPDEARAAGLFDERQADGVSVVEWADRLEITLVPGLDGGDDRTIRWRARGPSHARLAAALVA